MFIAPAIAPLRSTLWIPVLTPILARSDAEPHFQSTAVLIAWPAILRPTLWLLALLADIWQAGYMELNCSVSSFAAVKFEKRCGQRDLAMASALVASASSVASASVSDTIGPMWLPQSV